MHCPSAVSYTHLDVYKRQGSWTYTAGFLDGRHPGWNQFNLQTSYALSKRCLLYTSRCV
ncbi:hypothetical protein [Burkholderia plantarii]|uniref:hypothetical protein n=1 Tax=Burkholderia plantarii TaxID=41899 RepID=UPI0014959894|nr:hypothetical protein [Burkholderia plantarii]